MTLYNQIGTNYNSTRRADPFIAEQLYEFLGPEKNGYFLDLGCGTGNYLEALGERNLKFYGIDPSETMLQEARKKHTGAQLINACAELIPLESNFFNGVLAVLTFHHWKNLSAGLLEAYRVLKPGYRLVAFSFSPEQMKGYWLNNYFPQMMQRSSEIIPGQEEMVRLLRNSGFREIQLIPYFVQPDLCDHFLYSHKSRPEKYLEEGIRNNTSAFSAFSDKKEVEAGLIKLQQDIPTGAIKEIMQRYENSNGDYLFLHATK